MVNVIIEAAARILEDKGHSGFSTNAVAEQAGVSVGSLYQYFPSKDALIGALINRETSRLVDEAQQAAAIADGRKALSALVAACVSHQLRRPRLARLLDFEEARLPLDADTQRVKDLIRGIILQMMRRPELRRQPDPTIAAQDVMAIIKGIVDAAGAEGENDRQGLAERVERAIFGYLVSAPTSSR